MGNDSSTFKRAFEQLDKGSHGFLTLEEILEIQQLPEYQSLPVTPLFLLFKFDKHHDGYINFDAFKKIIEYLKTTEKRVKMRAAERRLNGKTRCAITRLTAKHEYQLSRNTETPMIIGKLDSLGEFGMEDIHSESEEDIDAEQEAFRVEVHKEISLYLDKYLLRKDGRQSFLRWLFKLGDTDRNNNITVPELIVVLKALEQDSIIPLNLLYNCDKVTCLEGEDFQQHVAKKLVKEYDVENRGHLNYSEFAVLGNIILQHYLEFDPNKQVRVNDYALKRRLGIGGVGEVRLGVNAKTGSRKAIKIVPKGNLNDLGKLDTEIKAMMLLKNKHIVQLEEVYENDHQVFFVLELCSGGTLRDYLNGKPLSENLVRYYFSQIMQGVVYCHQQGVCHRDLKLDNILLDMKAQIKISDFGHAGIYERGWDVFATPLAGAMCHLSPEQIQNKPYHGEKTDIWSLGIILYILLTGHHPFRASHFVQDITECNYEIPDYISPLAVELLEKMLVADPEARITSEEVMQMEWLGIGDVAAPQISTLTLPVEIGTWYNTQELCMMESLCNLLQTLGIQPLFSASTIENVEDEHETVKCFWPEKELKFACKVKEEHDTFSIVEFKLRTGLSSDFLALLPTLQNAMARRRRKYLKEASSEDIPEFVEKKKTVSRLYVDSKHGSDTECSSSEEKPRHKKKKPSSSRRPSPTTSQSSEEEVKLKRSQSNLRKREDLSGSSSEDHPTSKRKHKKEKRHKKPKLDVSPSRYHSEPTSKQVSGESDSSEEPRKKKAWRTPILDSSSEEIPLTRKHKSKSHSNLQEFEAQHKRSPKAKRHKEEDHSAQHKSRRDISGSESSSAGVESKPTVEEGRQEEEPKRTRRPRSPPAVDEGSTDSESSLSESPELEVRVPSKKKKQKKSRNPSRERSPRHNVSEKRSKRHATPF